VKFRFDWRYWQGVWQHKHQSLALDLGSGSCRVVWGKKVVFDQPSCLVYNTLNSQVVAAGDQALRWQGKLPNHLRLVWPLREGKIEDTQALELYLSWLAKEVGWYWWLGWLKSSWWAHPVNWSALDEKLRWQAAAATGWEKLHSLAKPMALARRAKQVLPGNDSFIILDMGATTTDVVVVQNSQVLAAQTLLWGGEKCTESIINTILKEYKCRISWRAAEQLKAEFINLTTTQRKSVMTVVKGQDLESQLPVTMSITMPGVASEIEQELEKLVSLVKQFLAQPLTGNSMANVSSMLEKGDIYLTGGASQLRGINEYLESVLGVTIRTSSTPRLDVARGCLL
jgi:rod shape-determining protein MreB and related proteins